MLEKDLKTIGNRLYEARKKKGLTQAQVAEAADLSDRNYADIERGNVNMRIETMIAICNALHITSDELLLKKESKPLTTEDIEALLSACDDKEKQTAYKLLSVYLQSV